jgi:sigma-E factor negative regulatory protein RseA
LAASLASLAILVGYSVRENTAEFSRGANLAMSSSVTAAKTLPTRESVAQSRFNDYLVIHNETAYQAGSPGLMPYARLVSSGSEF